MGYIGRTLTIGDLRRGRCMGKTSGGKRGATCLKALFQRIKKSYAWETSISISKVVLSPSILVLVTESGHAFVLPFSLSTPHLFSFCIVFLLFKEIKWINFLLIYNWYDHCVSLNTDWIHLYIMILSPCVHAC